MVRVYTCAITIMSCLLAHLYDVPSAVLCISTTLQGTLVVSLVL